MSEYSGSSWFKKLNEPKNSTAKAVDTPELDAAVGNTGSKKSNIWSDLVVATKEAAKDGAISPVYYAPTQSDYNRLDRLSSKEYEDTFGGQFGANRTASKLSQDASLAWNTYLQNPNAETRKYAEAASKAAEQFQLKNTEALDDVNAKATLLTKDLAGYLPQFGRQTMAQIGGGLLGAAAGPTGMKAGAVLASGAASADVMRGAAFKTLTDLGIDEDTAIRAASDEAFISGLVESADTLIDLATLGTGKLISLLGKGAAKTAGKEASKSVLKKVLGGLAKYGLNISEEALGEGFQSAVSLANMDRLEEGDVDGGKLDLAKRSLSLYWDRLKGEASAEDMAEIKASEAGGARLAALLGGATLFGSHVVNKGIQQQEQTSPLIIETRGNDYIHEEHHGQILDNVRSHLSDIQNMSAVASITGAEFQKTEADTRNLRTKVIEFFDSIGNKVVRKDIGEVALNTAGARDSLAHGYGKLKAATFAALPDVLVQGKIVSVDPNYAGRPYKSYLIAAPVDVGGETMYVGALVIQDDKTQRYKVHEVLTVDKEGALSFKTESQQNAGNIRDSAPSSIEDTIPQNGQSVKATPEQPSNPMADALLGEEQQPTGPFHPINEQAQQETQAERGRGPVEIPVEDINGQLTPKTSSTLANAKITPNDFAAALQNDVTAGKFSRIPFSDADAVAGAEKTITDLGWNEAMKQYESAVNSGQSSKAITALGVTLYNHAVNSGKPEGTVAAMNVASLLIENAKTTAQALQAVSIINKLSPEGRLYMVVRSVENIQQGLAAKFGEKAPNLKVNPELLNQYRDALVKGDEAAAKEAMTNITKDIASQVPATWQEQLQAWRYLAMLGNFRTQVRNIIGNLGFVPFRVVKNALATVGEQFLPEGMERTKAVLNRNSAADNARLQVGAMDFANVEDAIQSGGKFQEGLQSDVDKERTIFNNRLLEAYRKAVGAAMEKGDTLFSRRIYASSLAMYLKANGFTAADFTNGKMSEEQIARAREVAIQEAARATYRDANWLSEGLNKITSGVRRAAQSNGKGSGVAKAANLFIEGVLPFKKTPANVLARAIDYSPVGIIKGVVQMYNDVKAGKSAAEAIDSLAAGLTGTGVMLLGAFLRNEGILSGSEDEDDKQAGFDSLQGQQNYALTVGDKNYTIDWLAPGAVSLFVGAEIMDAMQDKGLTLRETIDSMLDIADPIVEMSMLSGVQDMLETGKYGDAGIMAYVATAATSYLSQYIPTLFGQIERSTETGSEDTYRYNDEHSGVLGPTGQRFVGTLMNKLPGEYNQVDYIDAWGRTQDYEKGNALNQFFNPAYVSSDRSTAVDDELQRLYDAGLTGVFPQRFAQSDEITMRDAEGNSTGTRHLTAEEYEQFNRTMGQTRLELTEALVKGSQYKAMDDDLKAKAIGNIFTYGKAMAMLEVEPNAKVDSWVKEAMESSDPAKYIGLYSAAQNLEPVGDKKTVSTWQKVNLVVESASTDEADEYIPLFFDTDSNYPKKYQLARERGYSAERFAEFYEAYSTIESDRDANDESLGNKRQKVLADLVSKGWPEQYAKEMYNLFKAERKDLDDWSW